MKAAIKFATVIFNECKEKGKSREERMKEWKVVRRTGEFVIDRGIKVEENIKELGPIYERLMRRY